MDLHTIEAETGASPRTSLIILHGLGADGSDFEPICEALPLDAMGPVRFVLPSAPVMPVTINGGYRMRSWYDIRPGDGARREDEAGLRRSQAQIEALIAREMERGIAPSRIVLMGFSQGCAMALMTGLRYPERLGAIVGLSGYLPLWSQTALEAKAVNRQTPIFLAHGDSDDVVPMAWGEASLKHLRALGYRVTWQVYPMAHSVCDEEVQDIGQWLLKALAPAQS